MHFKSGEKKAKATVEIGDKTYTIYPPTVQQSDEFSEAFNLNKDDHSKVKMLMKVYICKLGSIPMEELNKIDNDLFVEIFQHVTEPKKK